MGRWLAKEDGDEERPSREDRNDQTCSCKNFIAMALDQVSSHPECMLIAEISDCFQRSSGIGEQSTVWQDRGQDSSSIST